MEALLGKRKELLVFGNDYDTPDGTGVRDYIHVNDLAIGHGMAFDYLQKNNKSLIVNLRNAANQTYCSTSRHSIRAESG